MLKSSQSMVLIMVNKSYKTTTNQKKLMGTNWTAFISEIIASVTVVFSENWCLQWTKRACVDNGERYPFDCVPNDGEEREKSINFSRILWYYYDLSIGGNLIGRLFMRLGKFSSNPPRRHYVFTLCARTGPSNTMIVKSTAQQSRP